MEYPVIDTKATGKRIRELIKSHHMKVEEVARFMGFESVQAVYKWQRGDSLPTVDNLYALSSLFETSIDSIIIGSKEEEDASPLLPFYGIFELTVYSVFLNSAA
ncbi:MAG: helix-turn-helix domain-containing protein [Lachnospiraceae bacterium]|nr:helix-turn-helix domain-containing protein [Lachnospiraceae bacterium]